MNLLQMRGAWNGPTAWLYAQVVAKGAAPLYQRFVDEVVVPPPRRGLLVDVGSGDGQLARNLAEAYPDARVLGVDLSAAMVTRARLRHADVDNVVFETGDSQALPLADGIVDRWVSVASIKHWPDRAQGLREAFRVLRPGGRICVLEAERGCSRASARRFVALWRHVAPGTAGLCAAYFRRYVAGQALVLSELDALVHGAGFDEVESVRVDELPFIVAGGRKPP